MATQIKPIVDKAQTFDLVDIRLGRIVGAELCEAAPKKSYKLEVDFGKFGMRTSVARLSSHSTDDLIGTQVLGVLNFGTRMIGDIESDVLILGVQYPKTDSGEATPVSPLIEAKLGGKLF